MKEISQSGQWKWVLHWIQAVFWGYYCFWLSLEIGWLLFIPLGGLLPNLWPSYHTVQRNTNLTLEQFSSSSTQIVGNLITTERLQFSNLPFQRERNCKIGSINLSVFQYYCQLSVFQALIQMRILLYSGATKDRGRGPCCHLHCSVVRMILATSTSFWA